jgi:hypothetical protein
VSARTHGAFSDWRASVSFSDAGPSVSVLHESKDLKVVLVGVEPGQSLPPHRGPAVASSSWPWSSAGGDEDPVRAAFGVDHGVVDERVVARRR